MELFFKDTLVEMKHRQSGITFLEAILNYI